MSARPTPAQVAAIDHFAAIADGRRSQQVDRAYKSRSVTDAVCVRRGWLKRVDRWPYHAPTDAGRALLAAATAQDGAR